MSSARAAYRIRASPVRWDKHSKGWRTWKGGRWGYEGMLVDNCLALLAVLDDAAATP